MDTTFENIVPWNGANDTGLDVRKKWERNFDKIKQNFAELSDFFEKVNIGTASVPVYAIKSKYDFFSVGAVSAYGPSAGSSSPGSGIDEAMLWSIMGNTGTQQIAANHLATALSPYVTQSSISALLANYAPVNHGHVWGDITDRPASLPASDVYTWAKAATKPSYAYSEITDKPASLPASDVYAWAKASNKPSYAYSEITDKPSTLSGYGITDAASKSHSHVWVDITDRPTKLSQFTNDMISAWALAATKPSYAYSEITGCPTSLPASDVYAWAKAASKPSYSYSEISGTPDLSSLHTHSNKALLDAINQNLSSTGMPLFSRITIGAISLLYDSVNNSLYVQKSDGTSANFYATGGVSSYGAGAVSGGGSGIDETTLWSVLGNTGTQQIAANHLATALSAYVTQSSMSALLANYAPVNHGHVWGDITDRPASLPASDVYTWAKAATKPSYAYSEITDKPASLPASDVYAWAKASNKPSYAYSEITDKPSTLGGYGITDAMTAANINNLLSESINSIQIGGRNLLLNSSNPLFSQNDVGTGNSVLMTDEIDKYYRATPDNGKTVSLYGSYFTYDNQVNYCNSIYIRQNSGSAITVSIYNVIDADHNQKTYTIQSGIWTYLSTGSFVGTGNASPIVFYFSVDSIAIDYKKVKIEKGTKPTDWTPAPEDKLNIWDNAVSASRLYTARSFTIGNTAKSFDGTSNISWSLSEIGAAATIHNHTISQITDIGNAYVNYANSCYFSEYAGYLAAHDNRGNKPSELGTSRGLLVFSNGSNFGLSNYIDMLYLSSYVDSTGGGDNAILLHKDTGEMYRTHFGFGSTTWGSAIKILDTNNYSSYALPLSGGSMTNTSVVLNLNADLLDGYDGSRYLRNFWTDNPGKDANEIGYYCTFTYCNNAPYTGVLIDLSSNSYGVQLNTSYGGDTLLAYRRHGVPGDGGIGNWQYLARITDNVASATKLNTARSFTIGNTTKSFDGTYDVSWSLSEIGAAAAIHSHTISQITDIANASVSYAVSAGNANNLAGYSESAFLRYRGLWPNGTNATDGITTTGWNLENNNGYQTAFGDSLHIQGFSTWYNRLDFGTDGRIYFYQAINPSSITGCMQYKGTLAYLTDNVASATKLQTAVSIFGRAFDGTNNVSGELLTYAQGYAFSFGGYNQYHIGSNDGSDFYLWTGQTDAIRFGNNNIERMRISSDGNVGIGLTSPSYKLHVAGTGYFSDALNLAATMTAAGLITANGNIKTANYIEIGSTGIRIMYDSTNDCLKLIKSDGSAVNLLVTGGVTALATT